MVVGPPNRSADVTATTRVAVAAPDPLVRAALARVIGTRGEVAVVAEAAHADVVLWDAGASPDTAAQRLPELRAFDVPVVALVPEAAQAPWALAQGARGVVGRDAAGEPMIAALRAVHRGLLVLDPGSADASLGAAASAGADPSGVEPLTGREREVLEQLATGRSNRQIAARLGVSEHTAKFHVNSILAKLSASSRTEAVVTAARRGLVVL
jgi:DNA-binding NarL/FixJ family response regulator